MKARTLRKPKEKRHLQLLAGFSTLGGLLRQKVLVDIWQDTTLCDCDMAKELIQFLVIADGELEMTWDDTGLLVVTGGIASQLKNFGGEVLKDGSQVDRGT